jgi:hypothetical protein
VGPALGVARRMVAAIVVCSVGCVTEPADPRGTWGGGHVLLQIDPARSTLEFDCAAGSVDEPFRIDSSGTFDLAGTFSPGTGGPVRVDDPPQRYPARYRGEVSGDVMRLELERTDTHDRVGPFTLRANVSGRVFKCL